MVSLHRDRPLPGRNPAPTRVVRGFVTLLSADGHSGRGADASWQASLVVAGRVLRVGQALLDFRIEARISHHHLRQLRCYSTEQAALTPFGNKADS